MNKQETVKLISVIKVAFPFWGSKLSQEELKMTVELWHDMLNEHEYPVVMSAIKTIIAIKKDFPPTIAEVIEKCQYLLSGGNTGFTEVEAWALVKKAIRNSAYNCIGEFEGLPDVVKKAIRRPEVLRDWSQLETSEVDTVISSNFMRSYKVALKDHKEYQQVPQSVKNLIDGMAAKMIERKVSDDEIF
jgi:hypothetical protein